MKHLLLSASALVLLAPAANAEVRVSSVLSDHMVLQRDAPIHIWGTADAGEHIRIALRQNTAETQADALGYWSAYLKPLPSGGPYELQVQGNANTVKLTDILMGDLWIASGQSNMEMPLMGFDGAPLKDSAKEIAAANHPEIRLLHVARAGSPFPLRDITGAWVRCSPETAKNFSAAAYFFGRELHEREKVPIGLVDTTWGGTPAESWTSMEAIAANPALMPVWAAWDAFSKQQDSLDKMVAAEKHEDDERRRAGQPLNKHPWHPPVAAYQPASLFNGMIAPLTPLTIRGVIWYQGETNSALERAPVYGETLTTMIRDWRAHWKQGAFPFLFAQISSSRSTPKEAWGVIRDAQRRALSVANTAMAVTIDIGQADNVHPPDKQSVGHRLALGARALSYGEEIEYAGPLFARADAEGASIRVSFEDRSQKLQCVGGPCVGFELAGEDHIFSVAEAKLDGNTVVVASATTMSPRYVRYAWPNAPVANLSSASGLPTATFTSEESASALALRPGVLTHD